MQMISAIIRPERLALVRRALEDIGIVSMTITEVRGRGAQKGVTQEYRGQPVTIDYLPKVKVELVIETTPLDDVIEAIVANAQTGQIGDGKIFVMPVTDAVRVRTRERGPAAV
jgi:nitrogen regulatory protein P-II 1